MVRVNTLTSIVGLPGERVYHGYSINFEFHWCAGEYCNVYETRPKGKTPTHIHTIHKQLDAREQYTKPTMHTRGVPIIGSASISATDTVIFTNIGIGTEQQEDRYCYRYLCSSNSLYINGFFYVVHSATRVTL